MCEQCVEANKTNTFSIGCPDDISRVVSVFRLATTHVALEIFISLDVHEALVTTELLHNPTIPLYEQCTIKKYFTSIQVGVKIE